MISSFGARRLRSIGVLTFASLFLILPRALADTIKGDLETGCSGREVSCNGNLSYSPDTFLGGGNHDTSGKDNFLHTIDNFSLGDNTKWGNHDNKYDFLLTEDNLSLGDNTNWGNDDKGGKEFTFGDDDHNKCVTVPEPGTLILSSIGFFGLLLLGLFLDKNRAPEF